MAAARPSPTGNLLRKSRLFSLPPTLSPPAEPATSHVVQNSATATRPYPLHAAIATPPSSLAKGDWGLKRPLPSKATSKSSVSPTVRINHLDTFEHVTDFESANDHVTTLKKWQEISMPMSSVIDTGVSTANGGGRHESVLESYNDNTHDSPALQDPNEPNRKRFRFRGPWLAGQTGGEFEKFVKTVRSQKPEFLKMVRRHIAAKKLADKNRESRHQGEELSEPQDTPELSDAEFDQEIRKLRGNKSALGALINKFLDLAPAPAMPNSYAGKRNWGTGPSNVSSIEYAQLGPPSTHPTAGLSYLRTLAHMHNHPVDGPQLHRSPVPARILRVKSRLRGTSIRAMIGVGGFVIEDSRSFTVQDFQASRPGEAISPDIPGGPKLWVRLGRAKINADGKVRLRIFGASTHKKELGSRKGTNQPIPERARGAERDVFRLD